MIGIVGTIPDPEFPLVHGIVGRVDDNINIGGLNIPVSRCTPALIAAAFEASRCLKGPDIYAFLVGDIGKGDGSRKLYAFLERHLPEFSFRVLTFHYLQPDVDWHNKVLFSIDAMQKRPILIADAGFMYAAKMSGQAESYDFFTPDEGELAFLSDELAPHPFYTRGFILHRSDEARERIRRAFEHGNAARHLLVKGSTDFIVCNGEVMETVDSPSFPAMEAIGGTGDSLTGLLTALCASGLPLTDAAVLAAKVNRRTGAYVDMNPAVSVAELIDKIPLVLKGESP